jgi:phosphopentomutase|tara:strand:+ start:1210 stop:2445 length:1236 start_codon:yes stop_codon:yes gene_type:complete
MRRAIILVLDSFGLGATSDAAKFGDQGSNTLGHIAAACAQGKADQPGLRQGPLQLPNLTRLGLGLAAEAASGRHPPGLERITAPEAAWGHAAELSQGKDTPSGHWEIAGLPVTTDWGYFKAARNSFPQALLDALITAGDLPGLLGNCHASGTAILTALGEEHLKTGKPIVYTSADSVFQIAAHETAFGLQRLYRLCEIAKRLTEPYNIGRVIARPFIGDGPKTFQRTANRRDLTTPPPADTLLDQLCAAGREVISIGKIADIFAQRGLTEKIKAANNHDLFSATVTALDKAADGSLIFTNLVDFDMLYGHRRDVIGYAAALEALDRRLPELEAKLAPGDLALITADHGCDPTWPGSDHTREHVPVLFFGPALTTAQRGLDLGRRRSFADMGQTLAGHLGIAPLSHGTSCLP